MAFLSGSRRRIGLLAWLAPLILTLSPAQAQPELRLISEKTNYILGEPCFLRVELVNPGPSSVRVVPTLRQADGVTDLEVTVPGAAPRRYAAPGAGPLRSQLISYGLQAGDSCSATVELTDWPDGKGSYIDLFSEPGAYVIRVLYCATELSHDCPALTGLDLASDELRLTVEEPSGQDAEAYALLRNESLRQSRRLWSSEHGHDEVYRALLSKFPTSQYAPYARYHMGICLAISARNEQKDWGAKLERSREAANTLERLAREAGDTVMGMCALERAGVIYGRIGQIAKGQSLLVENFVRPSTSCGDRRWSLTDLRLLEKGLWANAHQGPNNPHSTALRLPLRRMAEALGFTVSSLPSSSGVTLARSGAAWTLRPGGDMPVVNGRTHPKADMVLQNGRWLASTSVIEALVDVRYDRRAD